MKWKFSATLPIDTLSNAKCVPDGIGNPLGNPGMGNTQPWGVPPDAEKPTSLMFAQLKVANVGLVLLSVKVAVSTTAPLSKPVTDTFNPSFSSAVR